MSTGSIHVASTTDDQASVDAAAESKPSESSDSRTIVTSRTDNDVAIADAARFRDPESNAFISADKKTEVVGQPRGAEPRPESGIHVRSTTDTPEDVEQVRKEAVEDKEANRVDYVTHKPKLKNRIAQLVRERAEAEARAEAYRAQLYAQHGQQPPSGDQSPRYPQPQSPEQQQQVALREAQRQTQEAYHQAQQRLQTPGQRQQVPQEFAQAQRRVAEQEKQANTKYPDYAESIAKLRPDGPTPVPPTAYCHLMMNGENPTDVAYHLSKSPETLTKVWRLKRRVEEPESSRKSTKTSRRAPPLKSRANLQDDAGRSP